MLSEMVRAWSSLRPEMDDETVLVFRQPDRLFLFGCDALEVSATVGETESLKVVSGVRCWPMAAYYGPYYMKQIEGVGKRVSYAEFRDGVCYVDGTRRDLRRDIFLDRRVDGKTGRVLVGKSFTGTFWFCRKQRVIFMRRSDNVWLGHFCTAAEWDKSSMPKIEKMPLPK